MDIEGIVFKLLQPVSGTSARGEWRKQEVVLEQQGEFGRKVCVSFWGDKAMDAENLKEGEKVTVSVNLESREYNGRWFTEARAWRIVRGEAQAHPQFVPPPTAGLPPLAGADEQPVREDTYDDLPF